MLGDAGRDAPCRTPRPGRCGLRDAPVGRSSRTEGSRGALRHPSMRRHIFWALFGVSMAVVLAVTVAGAVITQRGFLAVAEDDLRQECAMVATALDASDKPLEVASAIEAGGTRLTLIAADGTVLYDSREDASAMENHATRPEVLDALKDGEGSSIRQSSTVLTVSLYGAHRLENGGVVRLSVARDGVAGMLVEMAPLVAALGVAMAAVSALVARLLSRRLVAPLDAMDPMHPLRREMAQDAYAEVMPLLCRIEDQHTQIERQMLRLTDNDRMRVEFTANVTHELKTPLTVISGYAELIEAGIAAADDVPGFAGRIHDEAQHLTALVNDILTLSRMDEAERVDEDFGVREPVDLRKVCDSVAERLKARAEEMGVGLGVTGPETVVASGMPKLVDQIVYNLCDNALRYNKPHGTVEVTCDFDACGLPFVRVRDTGIGIAQENQEKVFNRFFRVDAGRSRETGGTGLGLAIVKHAARCQDARVQIESVLGEGTAITVTFCADCRSERGIMGSAATC